MEKNISPIYVFSTIALFLLTVWWRHPPPTLDQTAKFLVPPPEHIEWFHFGFRDSMADSLWLRWIQDSDACQSYKGVAPSSDIPSEAHGFEVPRHRVCDNSWGFKMLDAVTKLSPLFEMPYVAGAVTLSVLVEDYAGAKIIFDRGIAQFPNNWTLLYRASYHYLFDQHDLVQAADLLTRAEKSGAPYWLPLLAARLYSKAGQLEMGIAVLESLKQSQANNAKAVADIERRILELKVRLRR